MQQNLKARVFISCGQQKGTDEVEIANKIAKKLDEMGFESYIAVEEQSLEGIKEDIFRRLSESEYIVFIDFRRERLYKSKNGDFEDTGKHRGSLFSHQELAVATFLNTILLAFREKGAKEDDGILKFIHANCIEFEGRNQLPDSVVKKIQDFGWEANWRNEVVLERDDKDFEEVRYVKGENRPGRFYHIKAKNRHRQEIARNCVVYLESIRDLSNDEVRTLELVEFKWKGVKTAGVSIPPKLFRSFDAFYVYYDSQNISYLGINEWIIDWTGYRESHTLKGPGSFELTYVVFSENFSPARATFTLHIGNKLNDIRFSIRHVKELTNR